MVSVEEVQPGNNEAAAGNHGVDTVFLHFSVSDTGTGVSEDMLEGTSDSFYQTDGSSVRAFDKTGLELGLASKLVRIMGGEIWAESKEDEGNTFHFTAAFTASFELKHHN